MLRFTCQRGWDIEQVVLEATRIQKQGVGLMPVEKVNKDKLHSIIKFIEV